MPDVWELWQRAKTLEWDPQTDIPVGRAPPRALHGGADPRRAAALEPADMGRVRRHLGEPGAAAALLPREPPSRPALLLHHAHAGGGPARRGIVAHGRAPRRLLPPAAEPADGQRGGHARRAPHGLRPRHLARGHLREPGLRGRGDPDRRVQGHRAQGDQPGGAAAHGADPPRRGAPHRVRLAVPRRVGAGVHPGDGPEHRARRHAP